MCSYLQVVVGFGGHCSNQRFAELPHLCPHCDHHGDPWRLSARSTTPDDATVDFAFQCSRPSCRRVFVASYHRGLEGEFELDAVGAEAWSDPPLVA